MEQVSHAVTMPSPLVKMTQFHNVGKPESLPEMTDNLLYCWWIVFTWKKVCQSSCGCCESQNGKVSWQQWRLKPWYYPARLWQYFTSQLWYQMVDGYLPLCLAVQTVSARHIWEAVCWWKLSHRTRGVSFDLTTETIISAAYAMFEDKINICRPQCHWGQGFWFMIKYLSLSCTFCSSATCANVSMVASLHMFSCKHVSAYIQCYSPNKKCVPMRPNRRVELISDLKINICNGNFWSILNPALFTSIFTCQKHVSFFTFTLPPCVFLPTGRSAE